MDGRIFVIGGAEIYLAPFEIDFPKSEEVEGHEAFTVKRYLRA